MKANKHTQNLPIYQLANSQAAPLVEIAKTGTYEREGISYTGGDMIGPLVSNELAKLTIVIVNRSPFVLTEAPAKSSPHTRGKMAGRPARRIFHERDTYIKAVKFDRQGVIPRSYHVSGSDFAGVGLYHIHSGIPGQAGSGFHGTLVFESPDLKSPICVAWTAANGDKPSAFAVTANLADYTGTEAFQLTYANYNHPQDSTDGMLYSDRSHNDQIIIHGTMRRDQLFPGSRNERTLVMLVEENT